MAKVLIVEDDESVRQMMMYALEDEGHEVEHAPDGEAGLEMLDRWEPDVIALDMKMPTLDGWEFLERYRGGRHGHVPVVVVTAAPNTEERARQAGVETYLAKPFDLEELVGCVAAAVRRAAPSAN
jgi:DNA-binding response OmpR family regulator